METELSARTADDLDGVLNRLADILRSSGPPRVPGNTPSTSVPSGTTSSADPATTIGTLSAPTTAEQNFQFRSDLATELAYLMAIPPLTADRYRDIDEAFEKFFQMIKVAPYRPYVMSLLDQMFGRKESILHGDQSFEMPPALAAFAMRSPLDERSMNGDPEMEFIVRKMARDILGEAEAERAVPAAAVVLFYAVAGTGAGVAVGYHLGRIAKKVF